MKIKKFGIYIADLNPRHGTELGKIRPVVVVQTNLLNNMGETSFLRRMNKLCNHFVFLFRSVKFKTLIGLPKEVPLLGLFDSS